MSVLNLRKKRILSVLGLFGLVMLSSLLLAGCGSSSSGGSSATPGVSSGEIEALGSIFVNGVEFETPDMVELEIEGIEFPSLSDLQEGMTVEVEGSFNANGTTGTATSIKVEDNLEGPITTISETTLGLIKELTVFGQTVIVEVGVTQFDNTPLITFATLAVGQVIEVSGLPGTLTPATVIASRVELKADTLAEFVAANGIFEIKGMITNLVGTTFSIGALDIDFTGITPTNGTLTNGDMVEVKGTDFNAGTNTLTAASVEIRPNGLGLDDVPKAHMEGFVSALTGSTFMLNGQMVDFSNATFRGGIEADLLNGVKVQAEGPIVGTVLEATKITFKETVRIEDNAATLMVGNSLTLEGLGLTVIIDAAVTDNRITGLQIGDGIKLRGRMTASGALLATRIENVSNNNRVELQGPATAINPPNLTILGIVVDTSTILEVSATGSDFEIEDVKVSSAAFFSAVLASDNPIVKARADLATLTWDQIELEIEDD